MGEIRAHLISPPVKVASLAWLVVWMPLRAAAYPAASWLSFCAFGAVLLVIGIVTENRLLVSWQAVSLLIGQLIYSADAIARWAGAATGPGGTSYLFDERTPVAVRSLSLFHLVLPLVIVYAVRRLGYDRRALGLQLATAALVLPLSFLSGAANINLVWAGAGASTHAPYVHLVAAFVAFPLICYVPAHVLCAAISNAIPGAGREADRRDLSSRERES